MKDLELVIPRGDVFGFLGPNGAGKTTTIRMMLGLIRPTAGSVYINGLDVRKDATEALSLVGAIVEAPAFYGYLSGRSNLDLLGRLSGGVTAGRIDEVLDLVGLLSRADDKVKGYSQGMRQRLGIAQALLSRPQIVILDEPTNGLDPSGMIEIRRLIRKLAREAGISVFISSHLLYEVQAVCDHVAVINDGVLVAQGAVGELLRTRSDSYEVRVSDTKQAVAILSGLDFVSSVAEENSHIVLGAAQGAAARVNRALVEGGLEVHALIPREPSLEDFFLELTGGATGDRGRPRHRRPAGG